MIKITPNIKTEIRDVADHDMETICAIYANEVLKGVSSWEEVPPSIDEMTRRRNAILSGGYPYRVAEHDGRVVGYTYASSYRPRIGYRYTVENTIYVDHSARGLGIGSCLLRDLIDQCKAKGYRQMVAVIGDSNNLNSIGFHKSLGFNQAGVIKDIGLKFDRWMDSVIMQLPLANANQPNESIPDVAL